jgi:hypothetical protein
MKMRSLRFILTSSAILFVLLWAIPAYALQVPKTEPKVHGYGMWNDKYFLFAARVDDPLVSGTSTEEQVFPANDDGIELCFDVPVADGRHIISRLAISVAGGFAVLTRDDNGRWRTDNSWLQSPVLKFSPEPDGTLNDPSDTDRGFTVEVAIPWEKLGGAPQPLSVIGFNFVTRVRGENQALVSWSPSVTSEEDNENPARWGRMLMYPGSRPSQDDPAGFTCPKTHGMPAIDGKLQAEEWLGAGIITLVKPVPEIKPVPTSVRKRSDLPLLMAIYKYNFPDGPAGSATMSICQPRDGWGPWVSANRPSWHREQLRDIQRTGIEVILPAYSLAPTDRAAWSRTGLAALVQALKEERAARHAYPLVGMYLDPAGLTQALGQSGDLTLPLAQQMLYGAIREFYQHIPAEFRVEIPTPDGLLGYPVILAPPTGVLNWNDDFIKYADQAFARDFKGAHLVWMADPAWKQHGLAGLAAYPPLSGTQSATHDATGKASIAVLSPGYLDPVTGELRPAGEGPELREEWRRMIALDPDFILLSSWNDFTHGSSLAPTRQQGFALVDTLTLLVSQEAEKVKLPIRLKKINLPATLAPGATTQAEVILANTSAEKIQSDEHLSFDVRILDKNRKLTLFSQNDIAPVLLQPGSSTRLVVPISAQDNNKRALPEGDYVLQFSLHRSAVAYLKSSWLLRTLGTFQLPLHVDAPPDYAFSVLASTLHTRLAPGIKQNCTLTLRNDGARRWGKKQASISYHWYRVSDELDQVTSAQRQLTESAAGVVSALPKDVAPGEVISIPVMVVPGFDAADNIAARNDHFELVWTLQVDGKEVATNASASTEAIYQSPTETGARFVDSTTPRDMTVGQDYPVQLIISNTSSESWPANTAKVTYRWFYWDGASTGWGGDGGIITSATNANDSTKVTATVKAPPVSGAYYLVWELRLGNRAEANAVSDGSLRSAVMVQGGPYTAVELAPYLNIIAATSGLRRASGDFDGLGNTIPLETLPPDLSGNATDLYPCGYYVPAALDKNTTSHSVTFRYPAKSNGLTRVVACTGQSISTAAARVTRIHLLGAGTGAGNSGAFTVNFANGRSQTIPVTMSSWLESSAHGEETTFVAPYIRGARSDNSRQPIYLHHYVLALSEPGAISSVTLPDNLEMKVFAITLESATE